ncbi:MAG: HEAT repeat domain-containing protein, partial [Chloroflexota bacterium]
TLAHLADPAALMPLIEALEDKEPEVRAAVAEALGTFHDRQAVPKLIPLLQDRSWVVREAVATTLGLLGDPTAGKALLELLEKNYAREVNTQRHHQTMMESVIALGRIKDIRATPILVKILSKGYRSAVSDWQRQVRQAAAIGLGYLDQPAGVDALLAVLTDGEGREVREAAITGLSMLRSEESFKKLLAALNLRLFENPAWVWPRLQGAVTALGQMGNPRALPYLLPLVESESSEVRMALARSLAQLGEANSKEVLLKLLRDRMAEVRVAAAQALGHLQISEAAGALNVVLRDPNRLVAGAAQVALDQIKALPPGNFQA